MEKLVLVKTEPLLEIQILISFLVGQITLLIKTLIFLFISMALTEMIFTMCCVLKPIL